MMTRHDDARFLPRKPAVCFSGLAKFNSSAGLTEPGLTELGLTEPGLTEPALTEPGLSEPRCSARKRWS